MKKILILSCLAITLNQASAVTSPNAAPTPVPINNQGTLVTKVVGGYSYDQWGVPNANNLQPNSPFSLFFQTPDSLVSAFINQALNVLVNPNVAGNIPTSFNIPIPSYLVPQYNLGQSNSQNVYSSFDSLTSNDIYRLLTNTAPGLTTASLAALPAPMPIKVNTVKSPFTQNSITIPSTASFNLNTLLAPLKYDANSQTSALNFIQLASGMAQIPGALDMTKLDPTDLQNAIMNNKDLQNYLVSLRSYGASLSVGLSNLYYLFSERVAQQPPNTSGNTNLPTLNSTLQFENYIATRRFTDPNWIKGIQNVATPAELQRQNIYLLRDLLYVEYQRQMVDERILATLSVTQLSNLTIQKSAIQQIQQKVQSEPPFGTKSSNPVSNIGNS